jgi:hypothetical protein
LKHGREIVGIGAILLTLSALLYLFHFLVFRDAHYMFFYLVQDLAFLPVQVFLVVVVLERVLASREKQSLLNKLHMLIGVFYSEVGTSLLSDMTLHYPESVRIRQHLSIESGWSAHEFDDADAFTRHFAGKTTMDEATLETLKKFLMQRRAFLLGLLENPNLLEHESFTDLLWALFHLLEEMEARPSLKGLPLSDMAHLAGDVDRAYGRLATEWLAHARHLKSHYPYLFSLLMRTHPFQVHPSALVQ